MENVGNLGIQFMVKSGVKQVKYFQKTLPKKLVELDTMEITGDAVCIFRLLLYKKGKLVVVLRHGILVGSKKPESSAIGIYSLEGISFDASKYELRMEIDSYYKRALIHILYREVPEPINFEDFDAF
jgi:hypothetical protein